MKVAKEWGLTPTVVDSFEWNNGEKTFYGADAVTGLQGQVFLVNGSGKGEIAHEGLHSGLRREIPEARKFFELTREIDITEEKIDAALIEISDAYYEKLGRIFNPKKDMPSLNEEFSAFLSGMIETGQAEEYFGLTEEANPEIFSGWRDFKAAMGANPMPQISLEGDGPVSYSLDAFAKQPKPLVDDVTADALLRERTSVNFLTRKGGLELKPGMTQAEKRQAVKKAVERIARKKPDGEETGFETKEKDGIIKSKGLVSLTNEDALKDPEILDVVSRIFNGEDPVITPKEGKSDGEIQSGEGTGGPGALQEVYGESETDVAGGTGSGRGGGRSLGELAVFEGTRLAHDGERGEVSTASEQAAYLELKAEDYKDAVIDRYKNVTGLDVVVSSDETWETVFGKDSVKKEPAKALGGKIYLPDSSHTWSRDQITLALYHEGVHAMEQLGFQPYLDLLDEAGGYIAFGREEVSKLMNALLAHTKVTMDQFINDPTVRKWVYDELCAAISGHISVNQFEGEFNGKNIKLSDFFHSEQEFEQFVDRLKQVQDAFNARGENK